MRRNFLRTLEFVPRPWIRVIQDGVDFVQVVGPSNFMVEKLEFEDDGEFDDETNPLYFIDSVDVIKVKTQVSRV